MTAREALPQRRKCETVKLKFGGKKGAYHVTVGLYEDGRFGEVFISTNKIGTEQEALGRDIAVLISLCLQHGCTVETIRDALTREPNRAPSTIAGLVADTLCEGNLLPGGGYHSPPGEAPNNPPSGGSSGRPP
jgi:hypothetical protein